jgi:hypothetical protein
MYIAIKVRFVHLDSPNSERERNVHEFLPPTPYRLGIAVGTEKEELFTSPDD